MRCDSSHFAVDQKRPVSIVRPKRFRMHSLAAKIAGMLRNSFIFQICRRRAHNAPGPAEALGRAVRQPAIKPGWSREQLSSRSRVPPLAIEKSGESGERLSEGSTAHLQGTLLIAVVTCVGENSEGAGRKVEEVREMEIFNRRNRTAPQRLGRSQIALVVSERSARIKSRISGAG